MVLTSDPISSAPSIISVFMDQKQFTKKVSESWTAIIMSILPDRMFPPIFLHTLEPFWKGIEEVRDGTQETQ